MTRGDSRGDTEFVEQNADEGHHPLDDGSDSDMEAWWGASKASGDDEFVESTDDEPEIVEARPTSAEVRGAFRFLDEVNSQHEFAHRGCVMKNIPKFLRGPFRSALRLALREFTESEEDHTRSNRGWKLLLLLPRMLLHRPPRGREREQAEVELKI